MAHQGAPSSVTNRPEVAGARVGDLSAACESDAACVAFASFLRDNPGAHGTVSLAVRTAQDVLNGKFDKFNVMRRVLHLHRLCEIAAADGAARVAREEASAAASCAAPVADGDVVMEQPELVQARDVTEDNLFTGDKENVSTQASPVTAAVTAATRKRAAGAS